MLSRFFRFFHKICIPNHANRWCFVVQSNWFHCVWGVWDARGIDLLSTGVMIVPSNNPNLPSSMTTSYAVVAAWDFSIFLVNFAQRCHYIFTVMYWMKPQWRRPRLWGYWSVAFFSDTDTVGSGDGTAKSLIGFQFSSPFCFQLFGGQISLSCFWCPAASQPPWLVELYLELRSNICKRCICLYRYENCIRHLQFNRRLGTFINSCLLFSFLGSDIFLSIFRSSFLYRFWILH